jgi:hypothetical protein
MKKVLSGILALFLLNICYAQNGGTDKAYLHNGKSYDVKIVRVNDFTIIYKFVGEDAEQTIGKYAVKKSVYSSGREEEISEKVVVIGKEDWEKVVLIEDKSAITGLTKKGEIRGKTSGVFGFHTANSADKKAIKKLKEEAAEMGAAFILLTAEGDAKSSQGVGMGTAQGVKRGLAYAYQ